jgi:sugar phosphate isomerase/epimerase
MNLGIKMRLQDWERYAWSRVAFDLVEVHMYFPAREAYAPLLAHLRNMGVRIGMHYSWPLDGGFIPTFAVDDRDVREQTLAHLRVAIDYAAEQRIEYVLYHAGPRRLCRVSPDTGRLELTAHETPPLRSAELFLEHATALVAEARDEGVLLVVESETERKPVNYMQGDPDACELLELGEQSTETILALAERGAPICVDFANLTTAFASPAGTTRERLLERLRDFCRRVQPASDLVVHVVSVHPPFLRDTRAGMTDLDLAEGVFPDRKQTRALLLELAGHPSTVVIPEGDPFNAVLHNRLLRELLPEHLGAARAREP